MMDKTMRRESCDNLHHSMIGVLDLPDWTSA